MSNPSDKTETRMNKQPEKRRADLLNMSLEEIKSDLVSLERNITGEIRLSVGIQRCCF